MSLPNNYAQKIKSVPMEPVAVASDFELAYMLSFSTQSQFNIYLDITHTSIHCNPHDYSQSALSNYAFADFDAPTHQALLSDKIKNYQNRKTSMVRGIREGFKQFYMRVASTTYASSLNHSQDSKNTFDKTLKPPTFEMDHKIQTMRGNIPSKWPENLNQFHQELLKLPWNAFSSDSEALYKQFTQSIQTAINSYAAKIRGRTDRKNLLDTWSVMNEILIGVCLRTTNQTFILENIKYIASHQLDLCQNQQNYLANKYSTYIDEFFKLIPQKQNQQYHYADKLWDIDAFMIMKKIHFHKQPGLSYFSSTTDGKFLYIYVSSFNGGMFKIGTGYGGTIEGKIYLEREIFTPISNNKLDEVNWVYVKGNLYLKISSKDPGNLQVISPQTFKSTGTITLHSPSLFGHQSLLNINKNSILLTDGSYLYFLGKRIRMTKGDNIAKKQGKEQKQPNEAQQQKSQDNNDKKKRTKKIKKKNDQPNTTQNDQSAQHNTQKYVEIVLVKFDPTGASLIDEGQSINEASVQELFESFNGYFTLSQCRRALNINNYDLPTACEWLVDEGDSLKCSQIYTPISQVIITESEISNDIPKALKSSNEIVTKDNSLIHIQNINESIWTMDSQHITCYSETGIKIFSKETNKQSEKGKPSSTLLKTIEIRSQRNPQYHISYDPYNEIFLTFVWPFENGQYQHYFPTAVLISNDKKSSLRLGIERRCSIKNQKPNNLEDFIRSTLLKLSLFDGQKYPQNYRTNNWVWHYAQKIIQVNDEMNLPQSDKKKLSNKRSKILNKINKINQLLQITDQEKLQFNKHGLIIKEIKKIFPFAADGSLENIKLIRDVFRDLSAYNLEHYLVALENWVQNSDDFRTLPMIQYLQKLGFELIELRSTSGKVAKINQLLMNNFFLFFPTCQSQMKFIIGLSPKQLNSFTGKQHFSVRKQKQSIIYQLNQKTDLIQKFDSKIQFSQIFKSQSTVEILQSDQVDSMGNFILDTIILTQRQKKYGYVDKNLDNTKRRKQFFDFIEKGILNNNIEVKFLEFIFIEGFKLIVTDRKYKEYLTDLINMFTNLFKLIERILQKATLNLIINLSETLLLVIQVYYASLASLVSNSQIISSLIKIVEYLHKPQFKKLSKTLQYSQFEGVSQTTQKIYETAHPISRGKNQSYPIRVFQDALLTLVDIDKRSQSDENHDFMSIQTLHQDSPVGSNITCNDGIFSTSIRKTGKIQHKKPYLILGNSVNVQFAISGHANNAQSFLQYGFRFGLRPIFSGKIKYKSNNLLEIESIFGNKSNFEKYLNTVKFAVVVSSHAIQQLMNLPHSQKEERISTFLKGKIFREGFEDDLLKSDKALKIQSTDIIANIARREERNQSEKILKKIHSLQQQQPPKINNANQQKLHLWNFQGIPSYIKSYLEEIRQFKGDFINVFLSAREHVKQTGKYAALYKRGSFLPQYKQLWLQGQSILFLTVLKHSGLLHLNLKFSIEYIKQNLKAFEQARNGIFYAFISRVETMRQWKDLLETYWSGKEEKVVKQGNKQEAKTVYAEKSLKVGKKGKIKTIKIEDRKKVEVKEEKVEEKQLEMKKMESQKEKQDPQKQIRERLTDNYIIEPLCKLKSIKFVPDETYDNVTRIIQALKLEKINHQQSEYEEPITHLIKSCLFLLRLKSPNAQQSLDQQLIPQAVSRSYSQDNRNVNINQVNIFREWLENWKKWKGFTKEGKVQLKFPVTEIVDFVNSWIPASQFQEVIYLRLKRMGQRVQFYQYITQLVRITSNSNLGKYSLGLETSHLKQSFKGGLESVSPTKLSHLQELHKDYTTVIKEVEKSVFKELPLKLSQIHKMAKDNAVLLDKIKHVGIHLYLAEAQNSHIDLDVALYFIPFKHLSPNNQEIICLSALIYQTTFLCHYQTQQILDKIFKQIGKDSLTCKRWKDFFFVERILFLLKKLQENTKKKLQQNEKIKIAQTLFYLIYQTQNPILSRISLRIVNSLKINLTSNLKTPFHYQYQIMQMSENKPIKIVNKIKLQNTNNFNNVELLYNKFQQSLKNKRNPIKSTLDPKSIQQSSQVKYNLIINLHHQEDIVWMVKVLYYFEEIQKNINEIQNWQDYQAIKAKKKQEQKEQKEKKQVKEQPPTQPVVEEKVIERLLANIPENIWMGDEDVENQLPIGWFFSYCNVYSEFISKKKVSRKAASPNQPFTYNLKQKKNNNNQNTTKRPWTLPLLQKLVKKFEDLTSKPIQQPKEEDSNEIKAEFVKAKNLINRMRKHCYETSVIASQLNQFGYYLFKEDLTLEKAQLISQLITLGGEGRLLPIPCQFTTNDYTNKLNPNLPQQPTSTKMKISIIKSQQYQQLETIFNIVNNSLISDNKSQYYSELNQKQYTFEDIKIIPFQELPRLDDCNHIDIEIGKEYIESGLCQMKKRHQEVSLKQYKNIRYFISEGGMESGLRNATVVPNSDSHLTLQVVNLDLVDPANKIEQFYEKPQQLVAKIITKIKQNKVGKINHKQDIIQSLLLSSYLKKLSTMDLMFVQKKQLQELGTVLYEFIKNLKSNQPIQTYKKHIQQLIIKLWENENEHLNIFNIYQMDDNIHPTAKNFIKPTTSVQDTNKNNQKVIERLSTHHYPKSQYLLHSQPPQIEENKLLKYWDKNIIPKILQFVRTTLKPLQIEDFFEQIRIQLRINDQIEAKKIAYVICDNKLPNGAVLPDANHSWNSLSVEDIVVGQYALIKLNKNTRSQLTTPLLSTCNMEYRLVQVVFVEPKNSSVLVRYRLEQYSILSYMWVSVNHLVHVQIPIANYSTSNILKQLTHNFQGLIYGYSKLCLTQLVGVADIKPDELIKETVVDMFIDNPISGWLSSNSEEWTMRPTLKKMLKEGNRSIIEDIESKFYNIRNFEVNLLSEKMLSLNRFSDSSGLIISFKKTAMISVCSGVRFYSDPYGFNEVVHLYTAKNEKFELSPLQFTQPNIFAKYYTNKDCLRLQQQSKYNPKPIEATVFAVDPIWTVSCYLADVISQIAVEENDYVDILGRINKLFINWIINKHVALLCGYLCRLVSRICHRIGIICNKKKINISEEVLGIQKSTISKIIEWINEIMDEEEKQSFTLYSCLLQNLSEMVASLLCWLPPTNNYKPPQHVQAMVSMMKLIENYDSNVGKASKMENLSPQWERLLSVTNIPQYINVVHLRSTITKIFQERKGKILCPKYDIYHKNNTLIILVDGWDITELVEEEVIEKIQQQEEEKEPQGEQTLAMEWTCQSCTFINGANINTCQMCQSPMPVLKTDLLDMYTKIEATDVNEAEKKLKIKEGKRFEIIKEDIIKYFEQQWKEHVAKIEHDNKERETRNKNKQSKKKKNAEDNKYQELLVLPPKPQITFLNGSNVLKIQQIEDFLKNRIDGLPQNIRQKAQGDTYLDKFRSLLKVGYDLWGDNIYNENPSLLPLPLLKLLMRYVQGQICKQSSSVLSYSEDSIRVLNQIPLISGDEPPINFNSENDTAIKARYKLLSESKSYNIRHSWKFIKQLNLAASKCLQFINMNIKHQKDKPRRLEDCLGSQMKHFRSLIMGTIKLQLSQKIILKTSVMRQAEEIPKIVLKRLEIREDKTRERPITSKDKDQYMFTKAHQQFLKVSPAMLRPFKPKGADPYLCFTVIFKGQLVMGEAGPYRQFFTDISNQLDPKSNLKLFIPTPNNKHKMGQAKSKWTINPQSNSSYHLSLYEFLGVLMGCCIRTGTHLALDLPKLFWKQLVDEVVKFEDLEQVDYQLCRTTQIIQNCPNPGPIENLQEITGQPINWVYTKSDGTEEQMFPGGKTTDVKYCDRLKYVKLLKESRINESALQIKRVKKGIQSLVPSAYLNCLSGEEIKLMICGRPKIDVELLKKHTKYAGGLTEQSPRIQKFWEIMKEIQESQRLKLIRFCWGQERLPINSEEFERNNIRFMIKPMMVKTGNQDQRLPKADTCFFNIEIPDYSTKEIMKQKLLLALNLDNVSINADDNQNPDDNPLMNQVEAQPEQNDENQW